MSGSNLAFTSQIDPSLPTVTRAYTVDVRSNFRHAKDEIEWLAGLFESYQPGDAIGDAPDTGNRYVRQYGSWVELGDAIGSIVIDVIDGGTW